MVKRHTHKKTPNQSLQPRIIHNISCFILLVLALLALNASTCPAEVAEPNLNELVAQLDIDTADINDVIAIFGEPMEYVWEGKYFTRDNLPDRYVARYPYGFNIWMYSGRISEVRFESLADDYLFGGRIHVGSSLDEVLEVVGKPRETVRDRPCGWEDGVLYENIDRIPGYCYYQRNDQNVRFFFQDYKVIALYLMGSIEPFEPVSNEPIYVEPNITDPLIVEPNINDSVAELDFESADIDEVIRLFGEPADYFWMGRIYRRDNLPQKYLARYSDGFSIVMDSQGISELRFESANCGYIWRGEIKVGSLLDEVLEIVQEPVEVITGRPNGQVVGVLYRDINGIKGCCYYSPAGQNVKFFFLKNKVVALHLTRDVEYGEPEVSDAVMTESDTAEGETSEPNINERLGQLDFESAGLDEVIRIFGEPMDYFWMNQLYTRDNLPRQYLARYSDGFSVVMDSNGASELRFESADIGYVWRDGIAIGSWLEEALEVAGQPVETIVGEVNEWVDGVLYKDINGQEGLCYYARRDLNVRFFFKDYKVTALYVTGDAQEPEPDG